MAWKSENESVFGPLEVKSGPLRVPGGSRPSLETLWGSKLDKESEKTDEMAISDMKKDLKFDWKSGKTSVFCFEMLQNDLNSIQGTFIITLEYNLAYLSDIDSLLIEFKILLNKI